MEPTIRAITCPCCRNILFALEMAKAGGAAGWKITKDSPALFSEGERHFMTCGTCKKKIELEQTAGHGVESWRLAKAQNCN